MNERILGRTGSVIDPNSSDDWSDYFSMYNIERQPQSYEEVASTYGTMNTYMNAGPVVTEMPSRQRSYEQSCIRSAENKIVADMMKYNDAWNQRIQMMNDDEEEKEIPVVEEQKDDVNEELKETVLGGFINQIVEKADELEKTDNEEIIEETIENDVVFDDETQNVESEIIPDNIGFDDVNSAEYEDCVDFGDESVDAVTFDVDVTVDVNDETAVNEEDGFVEDSVVEFAEPVDEVATEEIEVVEEKTEKKSAKKTTTKKDSKKATAAKTTKKTTTKKSATKAKK